jgi:hypothetical protein
MLRHNRHKEGISKWGTRRHLPANVHRLRHKSGEVGNTRS